MATPEELDFASKLLETEKSIRQKINNSYKWIFGLTVLLFSLLFGLVKFKGEVSFEWLNLTLSYNFVTIVLSIALLLSQLNGIVLRFEGSKLSSRVKELYKKINEDSELIEEEDFENILFPDTIDTTLSENFFFNNLLGKIYFVLSYIIVGFGLQTVPIIAQVCALNHLFHKYPWNAWLITLSVLYGFVQLSVIASIGNQIKDEIEESKK